MTHGSLFSGIGGFDLAAEWMGYENIFHCEISPFCQRILQYYWPTAITYDDIKKTDFSIHAGKIDILTGGFPCQPYSTAGKRKGKNDDRHLWPEMLRAIREISPRYIVGENVYGLINWNGGMVFDEVQADLEAEGYEVIPVILPACAVNAPHRRDRVWFVACATSFRRIQSEQRNEAKQHYEVCAESLADSHSDQRCERRLHKEESETTKRHVSQCNGRAKVPYWKDFPTQSPLCGGNDGLPSELDGITFPRWRRESIQAYGNAIVPQVAYQIFQAIKQFDLTYAVH